MADTKIVRAEKLLGEISIPGDKSISHRGIMLGAISEGVTKLTNFLMSEDCLNTIKAFRQMGIHIEIKENNNILIHGKGLHGLGKPTEALNIGNSGTTARLLSGILAGQPFETVLDGDESLRKRPMKRVTQPLGLMGARIETGVDGNLPMTIKGGNLTGIEYTLPVASAQVKSAIILAALFAETPSTIHQPAVSRDHTEKLLNLFGGTIKTEGNTITAYPAERLTGQALQIPGDISSAAFFTTAGLICPGSEIKIKNVGVNPTRTGIIDIYKQMGADISIYESESSKGEPFADITVKYSILKSTIIEGDIIPRLIDEIPIIALAATQAHGTTVIRHAEELKVKETDRISAVAEALKSMGAEIEETADGMIIHGPTPLTGNVINPKMDHRIAMMGAIAGLIANGETIIEDSQWVDISFPGFFHSLHKLRSRN